MIYKIDYNSLGKRLSFKHIVPFLSGGLAFLVGGIILAEKVDPLEAYAFLIKGSLGSTRAIADTLVKTISPHCRSCCGCRI